MRMRHATQGFFVVWMVYTVALGIAVLITEPLELHRSMHPVNGTYLDLFFTYITHVGDGLVPTALALAILLFRDVRSFLMMGISCAASAIVVQISKHFFAHDRPFMFKAELGDLHWVGEVELHHHFSFPSGHATAAFSMCYALAVLVGGRFAGIVFAALAVLIAYSRVYLSQHFTEDILAGAAIGVVTAWLVQRWVYGPGMLARRWPEKRLLGHLNQ